MARGYTARAYKADQRDFAIETLKDFSAGLSGPWSIGLGLHVALHQQRPAGSVNGES